MASETLIVDVIGKGFDKLQTEFKKTSAAATKSAEETHTGWSKASALVTTGGLAIAGSMVAIGMSSIKAASDYETAHTQLVVALQNSKTSWEQQKTAIEAADSAARKLGFTDTETESALATMTRGMGSASSATKYLGVAQDLARAKNIDLNTAALAVTKGFEGQIRPLKQLGIDLPVAAGGALKTQQAQDKLAAALKALGLVQDKIHQGFLKGPAAIFAYQTATNNVKAAQDKLTGTQQTGTTILDGLAGKLKGSASAASDTFAGRQKILKAELDHVQVEIGQKLMPALLGAENWILKSGIPAMKKFGDAIISVGDNIGRVVSNIAQWTGNVGGFFDGLSNKLNGASNAITNVLGNTSHYTMTNPDGTKGIPGTPYVVGQNGQVYNGSKLVTNPGYSTPHYTPAPSSGKAAGGPVSAYGTYTVGEHGPETLVMGGQNGTIIPNGGGGSRPVILNFYGTTIGTSAEFKKAVVDALRQANARQGLDKNYGQRVQMA